MSSQNPFDEFVNAYNLWLAMRKEADRRYQVALNSFFRKRCTRQTTQTEQQSLAKHRDYLFAFYAAGAEYFTKRLSANPPAIDKDLISLNPDRYLCLICALEMQFETMNFLRMRERPDAKRWYALFCDAVCEIFNRPESYVRGWEEQHDWLAQVSVRVSFKAYDEIAVVLGLNGTDPIGVVSWGDALMTIATRAKTVRDADDWHERVNTYLGT